MFVSTRFPWRSICALGVATRVAAAQQVPADQIEKCEKPIGALAVAEPTNEIMLSLQRYQLGSPTGLIRMMAEKSNCFVVVDRGVGGQLAARERELAASGALQQGSNIGDGQMRAADYILTPNVSFSGNSGGIGSAIMSHALPFAGLGLKFKSAETSMLLTDVRSSMQVGSAEGKASKTDFSFGMIGWLGDGLGAAGGYTNTPEGKVIAASYLDNLNRLVVSIRGNSKFKPMSDGPGGGSVDNVKPAAVFNEGDVLHPKIDNVKILSGPSDGASAAGTVSKTDEVLFLGDEKDGFLHVQGASVAGWVKRLFLVKGAPVMGRPPEATGWGVTAFVGEWHGTLVASGSRAISTPIVRIDFGQGLGVASNGNQSCTYAMTAVSSMSSRAFYRAAMRGGSCPTAALLFEFVNGSSGIQMRVYPAIDPSMASDQLLVAAALLTR